MVLVAKGVRMKEILELPINTVDPTPELGNAIRENFWDILL